MVIKRVLSLVLCLLLLLSMVPTVFASGTQTEIAQIRKTIQNHYYRALRESGKSSFNGYCGLVASYQLAYLGINRWAIFANGKDQYDIYKDKEFTDTGYRVDTYSAADYTLESALNAVSRNGNRNVYNILVGFQKTNTAAGQRYGHAMVIYAIIDGYVYFTESFGSSVCKYEGYAASCTIAQFAAYYDKWTKFEGIVVFGKKDYIDNCTEYDANMYVQLPQDATLYSQPCLPGTEAVPSNVVRTVRAGERLLVTALYENTRGEFYYQVRDGGVNSYIPAEQVEILRFNFEDITVSDAVVPGSLKAGKNFYVGGEVTAVYSAISSVNICVTDAQGNVAIGPVSVSKDTKRYDLNADFVVASKFAKLAEGAYTYRLYADGKLYYVEDGQIQEYTQEITLCNVPFSVGNAQAGEIPDEPKPELDGWVLRQGNWHYYENGAPRVGWFCYDDIVYYLKEDGTAASGKVNINGKDRYFSDTGAMHTGWLETESGTLYLLSNGVAARAWREVDGKLYYFNTNGLKEGKGWKQVGDKLYYLNEDGSAVTGSATINGKDLLFDVSSGALLGQTLTQDGQQIVRTYANAQEARADLGSISVKDLSAR